VGLRHKHSNKEGTRRNINFLTSHAKLMLRYIKINWKKYAVLENVLNFGKQLTHYSVIYFFAFAFLITNNDNEETRYQLIID